MATETTKPDREEPFPGNKAWRVLAWATLGLYAWASVLTGAILPELIASFGLEKAAAGFLLAVPAIGLAVSGLAGGMLSEQVGLQHLLVLSGGGLALGLSLAAISPSVLVLFAAVMLLGFFGGMSETGSNGLIADLYRGNAARELNRLHIFFGAGAFIGPLLIAAMLAARLNWRFSYGFSGLVTILLTIVLILQPKLDRRSTSDTLRLQGFCDLARTPKVGRAWFGAFLLGASEMGFSNWLVTYYRQMGGFSPELASLGLSIFWLAIILGRYLNTHLPHSTKDHGVIAVEAFGSSLFLLQALYFSSKILSIIGLVMAGVSVAGLFPWLLAYATEGRPDGAGPISGFVQSGLAAGVFVGPAAIGVMAQASNLPAAMGLAFVLMFGLGITFILPGTR
jgi:DHA1 family quinolone resistance protein-like MFS transporter